MYKLVISDDEGKTIIVPLVRDLITVGRQEGNTIRLTERNVSRQHARLVKGEGGYRVEDLESYNGVLVNGQRIGKQAELKDGDKVSIGDYVIALKAEAIDAAAGSAVQAPRASAPPVGSGSPPARLVMISAPAPGAEFSISKPAVRIGRLEELDLCISHRSISREHARISQRDGVFEIEDLNSANGVRLAGSSTKKGVLKSGDIVELGQVRFRFVGPGESYVFDPSDEEEFSAPSGSHWVRPRTVAAVVVAVLAAGVLSVMDDGGAEQATTVEPVVEADPGTATLAGTEDDEARKQLAAALEECRTALAAEKFEDALRAAQNGLALDERDAALDECRRSADGALRTLQTFEQGKASAAQGKFEDAYRLFAELPDDYQRRPELAQVAQRVALARLTEARRLLRSDAPEAKRLASSVLELKGITPAVEQDAARLMASAERGLARGPASATTPRPSRGGASGGPGGSDESPAKLARSCLARGDQRCAVRALEGHAQTPQELALLIETYRALGETKKAVKHMESFVERYPTARQAPQYRQFIAKHE
jgi:pSer/pThr/pTyr-binding forkhead associated (FHA) protein/tetratricopeptide (TPR) repeat protein